MARPPPLARTINARVRAPALRWPTQASIHSRPFPGLSTRSPTSEENPKTKAERQPVPAPSSALRQRHLAIQNSALYLLTPTRFGSPLPKLSVVAPDARQPRYDPTAGSPPPALKPSAPRTCIDTCHLVRPAPCPVLRSFAAATTRGPPHRRSPRVSTPHPLASSSPLHRDLTAAAATPPTHLSGQARPAHALSGVSTDAAERSGGARRRSPQPCSSGHPPEASFDACAHAAS